MPDNFKEEALEKVEDIFEKLFTGRKQEEDITGGALQEVLDSYDRDVTCLKEVYEEQVKKRDDFNEVGFLLTDYCTDLYDGKQARPTYPRHEHFTPAPNPVNLTTNPNHHIANHQPNPNQLTLATYV